MNWQNIPDGYEFKIYFCHGHYSSNVVETIKCDLNDKNVDKIVNILSYVSTATGKYFEGTTEDVAQYISKKTNYNKEEILAIILPIIMTDIKWEENLAEAVKVEVYRYENNIIQKADIENKH